MDEESGNNRRGSKVGKKSCRGARKQGKGPSRARKERNKYRDVNT
jgi:hypothetical protein